MSTIFATWLQGAMNAHGKDARRIALALGVTESTVHNWLFEGAIPGMKNLVELARMFDVPTESVIKIAGYDIIPSRTPAEREQRRAEVLAQLPRYAEIAEKVAKLSPAKQDAYLSVIEKMLPEGDED
jgi:transcriptional regulator with XRE-family HTH domain